jgi:hypothetical protein
LRAPKLLHNPSSVPYGLHWSDLIEFEGSQVHVNEALRLVCETCDRGAGSLKQSCSWVRTNMKDPNHAGMGAILDHTTDDHMARS